MLYDFLPHAHSKEDLLLTFLLKLKFGLPFRALAIMFNMKPSTLNYNFYVILDKLYVRTQRFISWPSREVVQATMHEDFKPDYANCRVIIDCIEVKVEKLSGINEQFVKYSHYKSDHTFKVLVGNIHAKISGEYGLNVCSFIRYCTKWQLVDSKTTAPTTSFPPFGWALLFAIFHVHSCDVQA